MVSFLSVALLVVSSTLAQCVDELLEDIPQLDEAQCVQKIKVNVFYESKQTVCVSYLSDHILPMLHSPCAPYVDFDFIPAGIAVSGEPGNYICRHGESACQAMKVENCLWKIMTHPDALTKKKNGGISPSHVAAESLACANAMLNNGTMNWEACLPTAKVADDIKTCSTSSIGEDLLTASIKRTLEEGVASVPWITLNGKHDILAQLELRGQVCKAQITTCDNCCYEPFLARIMQFGREVHRFAKDVLRNPQKIQKEVLMEAAGI